MRIFFSLLLVVIVVSAANAAPVDILHPPDHSVPSSSMLDPQDHQPFLVSLSFRMPALPEIGTRENLITKYVTDDRARTGWAIRLRALDTSLRPEVYWRGSDGSGGWFVFDKLDLRVGEWCSLSLYAVGREFMNLFVQDAGPGDAANVFFKTPSDANNSESWRFLGGQDISSIPSPQTNGELRIGEKLESRTPFRGDVALVFIAHPEKRARTIEKVKAQLDSSAVSLFHRLSESEIGYVAVDQTLAKLFSVSPSGTNP